MIACARSVMRVSRARCHATKRVKSGMLGRKIGVLGACPNPHFVGAKAARRGTTIGQQWSFRAGKGNGVWCGSCTVTSRPQLVLADCFRSCKLEGPGNGTQDTDMLLELPEVSLGKLRGQS